MADVIFIIYIFKGNVIKFNKGSCEKANLYLLLFFTVKMC